MKYKLNRNVVYSCKYHVVWRPKYRRKVLTGEIEARLMELILETAASINAEIIEMEVMLHSAVPSGRSSGLEQPPGGIKSVGLRY